MVAGRSFFFIEKPRYHQDLGTLLANALHDSTILRNLQMTKLKSLFYFFTNTKNFKPVYMRKYLQQQFLIWSLCAVKTLEIREIWEKWNFIGKTKGL